MRIELSRQNKILNKPYVSLQLKKEGDENVFLINYGKELAFNVKVLQIIIHSGINKNNKVEWKFQPIEVPLLLPYKQSGIRIIKEENNGGIEREDTRPDTPDFFDINKNVDVQISYKDSMENKYVCVITISDGKAIGYKVN